MTAARSLHDWPERRPEPERAPEPEPSSAEHLVALSDSLFELARVEPSHVEDDASAARALSKRVQQHLQRAIASLRALERTSSSVCPSAELQFAADEPSSLTVASEPGTTAARATVSDLCFASVLELSRAERELARCAGGELALEASESALRKLRRAIHAVLALARNDGGFARIDAEALRAHQAVDLQATLAVRRLYADFRGTLRRAESDAPEAVLTALRYAAGALATLIASPSYARARLSDRALLRRLQARLLSWARQGRPVQQGLELLEDVSTCAGLLRGINRRQELRRHDEAVMAALLERLHEPTLHWKAELDSLLGMDDRLDELIGLSRADANGHTGQVRQRLSELLG